MKRILKIVLFAVIITGCGSEENERNLSASEEIRDVEEQWALVPKESVPNQIMAELGPMWTSTAFWYSATPTGAESMQ